MSVQSANSSTPTLDTPSAARFLGLSPRTLETWRVRGGGPPYVKAGGRVVYRAASLEQWLQDRERTSTSDRSHGAGGAS